MSAAIEAVCSVLIQDGVEDAPVVLIVVEVGTVAEPEVELDDPATAETTSMAGASKLAATGIDKNGADVMDGAAAAAREGATTGAKDGCSPIASNELSPAIEPSSKDPALVRSEAPLCDLIDIWMNSYCNG
jgi:hypothetical protein